MDKPGLVLPVQEPQGRATVVDLKIHVRPAVTMVLEAAVEQVQWEETPDFTAVEVPAELDLAAVLPVRLQ
jgi:hypothetical protein